MPRLHVTPKGRVYKLDGVKIPSVTTVLSAMPKALTQWAADQAASYAVDHWDELAALGVSERLKRMQYAHRDTVKAASLRGTEIHTYGEHLVRGEPVDVPDEHKDPVEAYARFLDRYHVEPVATETPVVHTVHGYGGRADLWAWLRTAERPERHYALVDLKSGGNIYAETVLQLAGYNNADVWQPDGPKSETAKPIAPFVYVAHILPDDVRLLPVENRPEDFLTFRYVKQVWQWIADHGFKGEEPLIGDAVRAPRVVTA